MAAQPVLEDFVREPDYFDPELSPDGRYLAQLWKRPDSHAHIVTISDLSDPDHPVVGSLGDNIHRPATIRWANSERLLIDIDSPLRTARAEREMEESNDFSFDNYVIFRRTIAVDADAGNPVRLLESESGINNTLSLSQIRHLLPDDPDNVLIPAVKRGRRVLYKVNVNTGEGEIVARGGEQTIAFLSDTDGNPAFRLDYYRQGKEIRIFESAATEQWSRIGTVRQREGDTDPESGDYSLFGIFESDIVYRRTNDQTGFSELHAYQVDTGQFVPLATAAGRDVISTLSSGRSDDIVGYVLDGDVPRYQFFDEALQRAYDGVAGNFEGYLVETVSVTDDRQKAIVRVSGQDDPGSYYFYDRTDNKLQFLRHRHSALTVDTLSRPALVTYKTRDGAAIRAYALLPADYSPEETYPLVVLPHGGPHARDRATFDPLAQFISTRGYVVIKPNFRGSTGYGKAFEEAGYRQWGRRMQDDITDSVDYMVRQGIADPDRVCIVGGSFGGYAALMGAVKTPDLYQCAVSFNGVAHLPNLVSQWTRFSSFDDPEARIRQLIGHPRDDADMIRENSPVHQVNRISIPLLVIAGQQDRVVPISHSRKFVTMLERRDKVHTYIELEKSGHNPFQREDNARLTYAAIESFLSEHLSP